MPRKKKIVKADEASDVLEYIRSSGMSENFFDEDVTDEIVDQAKAEAREFVRGTLLAKIEYLIECGWHPRQLKELVQEEVARQEYKQ